VPEAMPIQTIVELTTTLSIRDLLAVTSRDAE
jgi:hypothetical protein